MFNVVPSNTMAVVGAFSANTSAARSVAGAFGRRNAAPARAGARALTQRHAFDDCERNERADKRRAAHKQIHLGLRP